MIFYVVGGAEGILNCLEEGLTDGTAEGSACALLVSDAEVVRNVECTGLGSAYQADDVEDRELESALFRFQVVRVVLCYSGVSDTVVGNLEVCAGDLSQVAD